MAKKHTHTHTHTHTTLYTDTGASKLGVSIKFIPCATIHCYYNMHLLTQLELLQILIYVSKLRFLSSGTNIDGSLLCELKDIMCSRH